jgi:3-deoxy-D-manno-octulosonic-acid transferase
VAALLELSGARFQRRSQWNDEMLRPGGIFLLDTIGELASVYGFADLAFVGGSLVARGGHNVLEAAQFAKPILVGPSTENFRDIVDVFRRADALRVVTPETLTTTVLQLLDDDEERAGLGQRALEVMRSQLGATERTVNALVGMLAEPTPAAAATSLEKQA